MIADGDVILLYKITGRAMRAPTGSHRQTPIWLFDLSNYYNESFAKSKPYVFGKMGENCTRRRQKPSNEAKNKKYSQKTLVKPGKPGYSLTAKTK